MKLIWHHIYLLLNRYQLQLTKYQDTSLPMIMKIEWKLFAPEVFSLVSIIWFITRYEYTDVHENSLLSLTYFPESVTAEDLLWNMVYVINMIIIS